MLKFIEYEINAFTMMNKNEKKIKFRKGGERRERETEKSVGR